MKLSIAATLLLCFHANSFARENADPIPPPDRHLIICLDGVGFDDFQTLQSQGSFAYLKPAARLVAPFPSLTNPSMVQILKPEGADPSPGYEDRYYSLSEKKMKGGIFQRLSPGFVKKTFRRLFDFHPPGFLSVFEYLVPPLTCCLMTRLDSAASLRGFKKSRAPRYLAYIGATDCAAHTGGRNAVHSLLRALDGKLVKMTRENPNLRVTLFSDHGNGYAKYRRVDLKKPLKARGYRFGSKLRDSRSVVMPRYGLIGAAVLHVDPGKAEAVAQIVSQTEGVHFACSKRGDQVEIHSREGVARIEKRGKQLFYLPTESDPFDLDSPLGATPAQWFEMTKDHRYPDAVNRVWNQSEDAVVNRASVLVSFEKGYYEGSRALDLFVALKATHGSLDAEQSLGFVASTDGGFPAWVSSWDAWEMMSAR